MTRVATVYLQAVPGENLHAKPLGKPGQINSYTCRKEREEEKRKTERHGMVTSPFLTDFYFRGSKLIDLPCSPPIANCLPALLDRFLKDHGPFDLVRD
jgi:hypothetical protein